MTAPRAHTPLGSAREAVMPPLPTSTNTYPIVYRCKLSDEAVQAMLESDCALQFTNPTTASLSVGKKSHVVHFRPADKSAAALEFCLSRSGNHPLRSIAPVSGECDVEREMTAGISSITKKRTLEAEEASRAHTTQMMSSAEEPRTKRSRASTGAAARRVPEKRPRPSAPGVRAPLAASPLNGLASTVAARRIPHSSPPSVAGSGAMSRSPSPHVSPGARPLSGNGLLNGIGGLSQGGGLGGGPLRRANGVSGMNGGSALTAGKLPPRGTPPHQHPSTGLRTSKAPSPVGSRGASPAGISSAPSSPRAGGVRPKQELRMHVAHLLALGPMTMPELTKRLDASLCRNLQDVLVVVKDVGMSLGVGSRYTLKKECWVEVGPDYKNYSAPERAYMEREVLLQKGVRNEVGRDSNDSAGSQGSAVSPSGVTGRRRKGLRVVGRNVHIPEVDVAVERFVDQQLADSERRPEGRLVIKSAESEAKHRQLYQRLWTQYEALHASVEAMQKGMSLLTDARKEATSRKDAEALDDEIVDFVAAIKPRWGKYTRALNLAYSDVSRIKKGIADWCKPKSGN